MKKIRKIYQVLKFYCLILVFILLVAASKNIYSPNSLLPSLLFLPILGYFLILIGEKIPKVKKIFFRKIIQKVEFLLLVMGLVSSLLIFITELLAIQKT